MGKRKPRRTKIPELRSDQQAPFLGFLVDLILLESLAVENTEHPNNSKSARVILRRDTIGGNVVEIGRQNLSQPSSLSKVPVGDFSIALAVQNGKNHEDVQAERDKSGVGGSGLGCGGRLRKHGSRARVSMQRIFFLIERVLATIKSSDHWDWQVAARAHQMGPGARAFTRCRGPDVPRLELALPMFSYFEREYCSRLQAAHGFGASLKYFSRR